MKFTNKLITGNVKIFVIPIIMISLIFLIDSNRAMNEINHYFHTNMKKSSLNLVKYDSHNLSKGAKAQRLKAVTILLCYNKNNGSANDAFFYKEMELRLHQGEMIERTPDCFIHCTTA